MSKIKIIKNKNRDLIEKKCLKEIIYMLPGIKKHQIKSSQILDYGKTPVISQEKEIISGYYNDLDPIHANSESPIIIFGDHSCTLKLIDFDFVLGGDGTKVFKSKNKEDTLFLYYCIKNIGLNTEGYKRHFSILKDKEILDISNKKNVCNILKKQESVISNIEKLILKTEKLFDYFKDELLSGRKIIDFKNMEVNLINSSNKINLRTVKLNDIIAFSMGNTPKKIDDNYNGDIPWITISNLKSKYINNYTAFVKNSKSIKIIPKDTLIGSFKMSVGRFGFTTEDCCTNEAIIAIRKEDTKENLDYLYYLLPKYFNDNAEKNGQGIPLLNSKKIKDIMVDIPKLEDQNKIVDFLKKYENLIENQKKLLEKEKQKFKWLSEKLLSGEYLVVEEQE